MDTAQRRSSASGKAFNDRDKELLRPLLPEYLRGKGIDASKPFECINPEHDDHSPSMSYDAKNEQAHCFACGAKYDIFDAIGILDGVDGYIGQLNMARELFPLPANSKPIKKEPEGRPKDKRDYSKYIAQCQAAYAGSEGDRYLQGRGISPKTAAAAGFGWNAAESEIIIPSIEGGFVRRSIKAAGKDGRYKFAAGVGRDLFWPGAATAGVRGPVFVTEGAFDAVSFWEAGQDAIALNSTGLGQRFLELAPKLKGRVIAVAMDSDSEGQKAQREICKGLEAMGMPCIQVFFPTGAKDANDFLVADRAGFVAFAGRQAASDPEAAQIQAFEWPEIEALDDLQPSAFPISSLPWASLLDALSRHSQTDPAMAAVLSLAVVAASVQGAYFVKAPRGNTEPLTIQAVAIAESGERKSGLFRNIMEPLYEFETDYNAANKEAVSESQAVKARLENEYSRILRSKNASKGDVVQAKLELDRHEEARELKLIADDITPEKLITVMCENHERILLANAEGGMFSQMKGRYTQNSDATGILLNGHDGDRIDVGRMSRAWQTLHHPAVCVCVVAQPYLLEHAIMEEANNGKGLTARFVYAYCNERAGSRLTFADMVPDAILQQRKDAHKAVLSSMLNSAIAALAQGQPKTLLLTSDATAMAAQYNDHIAEKQIVTGMKNMKAWYNKRFGLMLRIAGLIHVYSCFQAGFEPTPEIGVITVTSAICITEAITQHAERAFNMPTEELKDAEYTLKRIEALAAKEGKREIDKQALHQDTKRHFRNSAEGLKTALEELQSKGYIKLTSVPTKGRPKESISISPRYQMGLPT